MKRSSSLQEPPKKLNENARKRQHTEVTITKNAVLKSIANKALRSCFLRNRNPYFEGVSMPVLKKRFKTLESLLETLTVVLQRHVTLKTAIRRIYRIDGAPILSLDDILEGDIIVCCCQYETFVDVGYKVNRNYIRLLGNLIHLRGKYHCARKQVKINKSLLDFDIEDLPKSISLYIDVPNFIYRNKASIIFEGIGRADRSKLYIVKMVDKDYVAGYRSELLSEVKIIRNLQSHPNIIELIYSVEQPIHLFLVTERMNCDLFELMSERPVFPETLVRFVMKNVSEGLRYIHANHIIHRDIKMENLLVGLQQSPDGRAIHIQVVKIADFGLATYYHGRQLFQWCGTPHYMAPEIINYTGYDYRIDCWSLGITLHNLLFRRFPFGHEHRDKNEIWKCIKKKNFDLQFEDVDMISVEALNLLKLLLTKSKECRLSALEILKHPFLKTKKKYSTKL